MTERKGEQTAKPQPDLTDIVGPEVSGRLAEKCHEILLRAYALTQDPQKQRGDRICVRPVDGITMAALKLLLTGQLIWLRLGDDLYSITEKGLEVAKRLVETTQVAESPQLRLFCGFRVMGHEHVRFAVFRDSDGHEWLYTKEQVVDHVPLGGPNRAAFITAFNSWPRD